jgi:hypothetical protein
MAVIPSGLLPITLQHFCPPELLQSWQRWWSTLLYESKQNCPHTLCERNILGDEGPLWRQTLAPRGRGLTHEQTPRLNTGAVDDTYEGGAQTMNLSDRQRVDSKSPSTDTARAALYCEGRWAETVRSLLGRELTDFLGKALRICAGRGMRYPKVMLIRLRQHQRYEWSADDQS